MNEENIKNIVLNLLKSWGLDTNEIKLEESFTIKFGKGAVRIDNLKQISSANPRTDILVTKNNKNLFIFELKASSVKIDNDDIQQGISYARLTKQITPFIVITNGTETRIFKCNGEELKLNDKNFAIKIKDFDYTLSLDIENLYYQATQYLIGMSPYNLSVFCNQQIISRMETLKGDDVNSEEKYIPGLFIERVGLYEKFKEFLTSDKTCFSIVGESGTGKTNIICDLSLKYASDAEQEYLAYFYNCSDLYNDITENIKEDFNLHFSQQNTAEQIIKNLSNLSQKRTIIFFDAIDENTNPNFAVEFNNLVRIAKDKNIKICFTCKDIEYDRFVRNAGNPSIISKNIYCKEQSNISYYLENFSSEEYEIVEQNYIKKYNLLEIPYFIKHELRNGFLLRIYAEIHKNKKEFHAQNIITMVSQYIEQKLDKMYCKQEEKDIAKNILIQTGNIIWNNSIGKDINKFPVNHRMSDKIAQNVLTEALGLKVTETLPNEIFEYKILQKTQEEQTFISFYYTRFRDYIIGFRVLNIEELSDSEFNKLLPTLYSSNIGISIIQWYYKFASDLHKNLIEKYFINKVLLFINEYNILLDKYFKEIKNIIFPKIINNIAIAFLREPSSPSYFLYPKQNNNDIITIFDDYESFNKAFKSFGGIVSGLQIDEDIDMKTRAFIRLVEDVLRSLKNPCNEEFGVYPKYYPKSLLNPENNEIILNERTYNLFNNYAHLLGYKYKIKCNNGKSHYLRYKQKTFPIKIADILEKINRLKIKVYLENLTNENINQTIFSFEGYDDVLEYNNNEIDEFIKLGNIIPNIKIEGIDVLEKHLKMYQKFSTTLESPLPMADLEIKQPLKICESINGKIVERLGENIICDSYSMLQRNKYCTTWVLKMYESYTFYVEEFFPRIKNFLYTYSNLPLKINYKIKDSQNNINNPLYCCFCFELMFKQKQEQKVQLTEIQNFATEYNGYCLMPHYPESIEESAIQKISEEINQAYKKIAEKENIIFPQHTHINIF